MLSYFIFIGIQGSGYYSVLQRKKQRLRDTLRNWQKPPISFAVVMSIEPRESDSRLKTKALTLWAT